LLLVLAIWLDIPIIRAIIVFAYLSFVPGYAILKVLKPREFGFLNTFLISIGLSLFVSMFISLLVNELYIFLGYSQPLSVIPLTVAISAFTLIIFTVGYMRGLSIDFASFDRVLKELASHLPLTIVLFILPILSIIGALYVNVPVMIISFLIIVALCILCVTSNKIIPRTFYPLLIFSIALSILLLNLLMSKYIIGDDANLEYYIFKVTQLRGYWGPIDADANSWTALTYNSMLSVTLLPSIYSVLMNIQNTFLFKILYSFILSMVPLGLYAIYKNELGKITGLLSVLFFVFTFNAFFGELISVNRQIVAEFFLILSIFVWLNKNLPIKEKKILLIIFGIAITVSHYSLALIYIAFVSVIVLLSSLRPQLDDSFSASTVLGIFGVAFLWYAFSSGSILTLVLNTVRTIVADLGGSRITQSVGGAGVIYGVPEVFTTATWINAVASGLVTLSLLLGILAVAMFSKKLAISNKYQLVILFASILFFISYLLPSLAATLNFTRFYAISFLFLSPCIAIGALGFLKIIQKAVAKNKNCLTISSPNKHGKVVLLLVAFLLCAYFLSQNGFVNYSTGGAVHNSSPLAFYIMKNSNELKLNTSFTVLIHKIRMLSVLFGYQKM
jgi:uncharacterized membrane protein